MDTISNVTPEKLTKRFDWEPLYLHAVHNPGEWFVERDPDRSKTKAAFIRKGTPRIFEPAGAFDAVVRADGIYIRYVGVPINAWTPWDEPDRTFHSLVRTFDPDVFPQEMFDDERFDDFIGLMAEVTPAELRAREPHVLDPEDRTRLVPASEHYAAIGKPELIPLLAQTVERRKAAHA